MDPLTPTSLPPDDSLNIPMSQSTGLTTFNKEEREKEEQEYSLAGGEYSSVLDLFVYQYLLNSEGGHAGVGQVTSFYTTDFPAHVDAMHGDTDKQFEIEYSVSRKQSNPNYCYIDAH